MTDRHSHLQLVMTGDHPDTFRHQMWDQPIPQDDMPLHIRRVKQTIATELTPFDGRPNSEYVTSYFGNVYAVCNAEMHRNVGILMGTIWFLTEQHVDRQETQVKKDILYQLGRKLCRAAYEGRR